MSDTSRALTAIADGFGNLGYHVSESDARIPFAPLGLEFRIADVAFHRAAGARLVRILVEAAALGDQRPGVRVNAVGFGPTEEAALREAAEQWLDGVFPVLHHWLAPHATDLGIVSRELLVVERESGRRFAWRVHLGPLLFTRYGDGEAALDALPVRDAILRALFDELAAVSAHETVSWVEAFVGRVPGHAPEATCLLRNCAWPEGEAALLEWAVAQPQLAGMGARQFLLLQPVRPEAIASASLDQALEAELARGEARADGNGTPLD
jgi:hypothetical protein